jgi:hypothetical protein
MKKNTMPRDVNQRGAATVAAATSRHEIEDTLPTGLVISRSVYRKVLRLPIEDEVPQSQPTKK